MSSDPTTPGGDGLQLDEFQQALGDDSAANPVGGELEDGEAEALQTLYDIPVNITAVLGRAQIEVNNLVELGKGDVVELDRKVGEAIDIFVNNRLVARGEVVLVEDRLGITMTEIIKNNQ
jgi:flagellar motor switch protein FliN/FliY